jgi:hypothetical protein
MPVRTVDVDCAISADGRSRELAVATPDRQIAPGIGYRQTGALAGPAGGREWPFAWAAGTALTAEQAAAGDESRDERTCGNSCHDSL